MVCQPVRAAAICYRVKGVALSFDAKPRAFQPQSEKTDKSQSSSICVTLSFSRPLPKKSEVQKGNFLTVLSIGQKDKRGGKAAFYCGFSVSLAERAGKTGCFAGRRYDQRVLVSPLINYFSCERHQGRRSLRRPRLLHHPVWAGWYRFRLMRAGNPAWRRRHQRWWLRHQGCWRSRA